MYISIYILEQKREKKKRKRKKVSDKGSVLYNKILHTDTLEN